MKVEVKEDKQETEIKYPCLMVADDGELVLFHEKDCGIQLNGRDIGEYSETWDMDAFKPFNGTVTLSND